MEKSALHLDLAVHHVQADETVSPRVERLRDNAPDGLEAQRLQQRNGIVVSTTALNCMARNPASAAHFNAYTPDLPAASAAARRAPP